MEQDHAKHLEEKLDKHIEKHDVDNTKLLWWIISVLIMLLVTASGGYVSFGRNDQRLANLESVQKEFVTRAELTGAIALINNKFENISDKLDEIKNVLSNK